MANPEHFAILKQGVQEWNRWRQENQSVNPRLSGAQLDGMILVNANFKDTDLAGAHLREAFLQNADLTHANLARTDLRGAVLTQCELDGAGLHAARLQKANLLDARVHRAYMVGADLGEADLNGTDFFDVNLDHSSLRKATLYHTMLRHVRMRGVDLTDAQMFGVTIAHCDLGWVVGLETISHRGPSSIGIETLVTSGEKIPGEFLRGCGVPDIFIETSAVLNRKPFEFYSCFISHSSKDQEFAKRLHSDLQAHGVRCWFAPKDLKIGDKIRPTIDEAIRLRDKVLLVLSEHSVQSDWVEKEVETALEIEREEKRTVLFPIRLDDAVMAIRNGWPGDIRRTRHIGDFTHWKDRDAYQKALADLIRDLKPMRINQSDGESASASITPR